jgi:hypothetical protein
MVERIQPIWNYDRLYLGGGNSRHLKAKDLPANVAIRSNQAGLLGGIALWRAPDQGLRPGGSDSGGSLASRPGPDSSAASPRSPA